MEIVMAPEVAGLVRLAVLELDDLRIGPAPESFWAQAEELFSALVVSLEGKRPSELPGVAEVRRMYRATGIDPTRYRPSCEALLRRVVRGKPLYRINNLVDLMNYWSIKLQAPACAHDLEKIVGDRVVVRLGAAGEWYPGIEGKKRVSLERWIVLADAEGPFGNPSADSHRTRITEATRAALLILYSPPSRSVQALEGALAEIAEDVARWCGGRAVGTRVLPEGDR
jgi:DNA/RNA-binding domain of Phe-tRNA-synthetase-like protein